MSGARAWLPLALLCLGGWSSFGPLAAQTTGTLNAGPGDRPVERPVVFDYHMAARVRRPGGSGWLTGVLANRGSRALTVEVFAGTNDFGGSDRGARFVATLEPGTSADVLLPVPYPGSGWSSLTLRTDAFSDSRQLEVKGDAHLGLLVVAEASHGAALGRALAEAANTLVRSRHASPAEEADVVPPAWLPPRWTLLSGFDVILLGTGQLDAGQQRVLVDAVSAGARLLVTGQARAALSAGPLLERLAGAPGDELLTWGFGSVCFLEDESPPEAGALWRALALTGTAARAENVFEAELQAAARTALSPGAQAADAASLSPGGRVLSTHRVAAMSDGRASGLPFEALLLPLRLTSLLAVPTGFFALVVVGYVLLLAFLLARELRRRTPLRLLLLLPATGCGLTVIVLGGGLLLEGTSVRGASRSLALLDQQAHEAVVAGGRTLYAGLGMSSAQPGPGTQVVPLAALAGNGPALLVNAHEGGRLAGGLLPARTPVSFALTSVGPSRERLLVRAGPDGGLRLVAEESFRPAPVAGSVVLRLPDGRGFVADADGVLQPVDDEALRDCAGRLLRVFRDAPLLTRGSFGERWNEDELVLPGDVAFDAEDPRRELTTQLTALLSAGLAPGSYLAQLEEGTLLDDLGLNIDAEAGDVHLVLGRFAAGDVP